MVDYRVNLDIFAGPLDLLLYLVRKEEVEIYDIPISVITDQYIKYVEMLKDLDIDVAGDFLVMAATLMEIKSAMLLPKVDAQELDDAQADDPRAELVRQLLEYKKFKDAANLLNAASDEQSERYTRPDSIISRLEPHHEPDLDLDQINIWNLLEAFDEICRATGQFAHLKSIKDDTPIDLYQIELLARLQMEGSLTFRRLFEDQPNRLVMVGQFLALLELIRGKLVWVEQGEHSPDLYLRALTDEPAEQAVNRVILAVGQDFNALSETENEPETQVPESAQAEKQDPEEKNESPTSQTRELPIAIVELPAKPSKIAPERVVEMNSEDVNTPD
ncbi:MAG: segregation/condensation protein A [Phycisphaerae bacterium]|nr:segregation/condensation protein A [Phycisphaerae bacterium]